MLQRIDFSTVAKRSENKNYVLVDACSLKFIVIKLLLWFRKKISVTDITEYIVDSRCTYMDRIIQVISNFYLKFIWFWTIGHSGTLSSSCLKIKSDLSNVR